MHFHVLLFITCKMQIIRSKNNFEMLDSFNFRLYIY